MALSDQALSANDTLKLKQFMDAGMRQLQEQADIRDSLKDTCKAIAEELNIKPRDLMKALRVKYKASMADEKESFDTVSELVEITGGC